MHTPVVSATSGQLQRTRVTSQAIQTVSTLRTRKFVYSQALLTDRLSRRKVQHRHELKAVQTDETVKQAGNAEPLDASKTTEKYGLEAGLFKVLTNKDATGQSRTDQAKALLAKYGSAYLITSISFAIVSFSACYALVSAGVDVVSLLDNVGLHIEQGSTGETVGTLAIAYAAHKALSPVRFPPTVALTPVVAQWLGRDKPKDS